jgi:glycosyltransferase involved in cell wall biosynthesis
MGILAPHKGVELILKVFSAIDAAELFLYGKSMIPNYEDHLRGKYSHNNIRFMGFQPMEDALSNIDVLLVPSLWYEPFSRVVVESFYYGVPVIASRQGGPLEIIEEGKTGFLFSTDRDEELVAIIRRIIKDPAILDGLKDNCLRKSEEFTLDKHIERYKAIYSQLT